MKNKIRILYCEDEQLDAALLIEYLNEHHSDKYAIDHVSNLEDAMEKIKSNTEYDLILTDLQLPDSYGLNTATRLMNVAKDMPLAVLTSHIENDVGVEAIKLGAQDIIVKENLSSCSLSNIIQYAIERKKNETNLKNATLEIERLIAHKNEMLAVVSHDLRGPIGNILNLVEVLCEDEDEFQSKIKTSILRQGKFCLSLIGELLENSYTEDNFSLELKELNLTKLLNQIIRDHSIDFDKLGIQVNSVLPIEYGVIADEKRIIQLFNNLLGNSRKFLSAGDAVTISVDINKDEQFIHIIIEDTGPGILPEKVNKIFDKYEQCQKGDRDRGFGLGLTICKKIAEGHGGRIWAENKNSKGAKFILTLPRITLNYS